MKNLTDLIAEKAKNDCVRDVNKFCKELTKNPYFKPLHNLEVNLPNGELVTLGAALYNSSYELGALIVDYFLPSYIQEESEQFYNKVNKLP